MILKLLPKLNQTNKYKKWQNLHCFYLLFDQWCWLEKWTDVGKVKNDEER